MMVDRTKFISCLCFAPLLRMRQFILAALMFLCLVALGGLSAASAGDVYIVDTVERDAAQHVGRGLQGACRTCGKIQYRHMNGNMRAARKIAEELYEEERAGNLSLVVTLGRPATQVIAERLETTPVIYTFVGQEIPKYSASDRILALPTDASLDTQIKLLQQILPGVRNAGIILSSSNNPALKNRRSAHSVGLNIYRIKSPRELPDAIRTAVQDNDALILLRDRMVINNDSIQFVLRHTLENGRHTIAYSPSLVDMGLAAALVPRPEAFGRRIGDAAETFLTGGALTIGTAVESDYHIHTNPRVIERLKRRSTASITPVKGARK